MDLGKLIESVTSPEVITVIVTWFAALLSRNYFEKLEPKSLVFRVVRALHLIFNKVDPDGNERTTDPGIGPTAFALICLSLALPLQGCALLGKASDVVTKAHQQCETTLQALPEVIEEASLRGVSVGQLVDAFCGLVDVAAVFTDKTQSTGGARLAAQKPADQAVSLLRAKGEIQ